MNMLLILPVARQKLKRFRNYHNTGIPKTRQDDQKTFYSILAVTYSTKLILYYINSVQIITSKFCTQ